MDIPSTVILETCFQLKSSFHLKLPLQVSIQVFKFSTIQLCVYPHILTKRDADWKPLPTPKMKT